MKKSIFSSSFMCLVLFISCRQQVAPEGGSTDAASTLPNIIIFYADDLGYGDLSCYGAKGVETPNIDKLAANGILFTDAHSTSATCTPSRYSLMTGEYAFRRKAAVLPGDAPLLIDTSGATLPSMLKKAGYKTGIVGKWHLGLGNGDINWNGKIAPGPLQVGFDYSFIIPATGDRVPTVYVENHLVVNHDESDPITISYDKKIGDRPTGTENPESLRFGADPQHSNTIVNGVSRIGFMAGGEKALWVDEEFPEVFTSRAKEFMKASQGNPFFLFFPFHDIHVPRLPHKRFLGKSKMGLRGDAIVQMDWMTGEIMKYLKDLGIYDNTLVIFTSDNGPVLNDGYEDGAVENLGEHQPSGIYRGGKYSAFEAGTRVPMLISWPTKIQKAKKSPALVSQVDFYASLAKITGQKLAYNEAIDSEYLEAQLLGTSDNGRVYLLEESFTLGLRSNQWKYIEPYRKGNVSFIERKGIESGAKAEAQLFDLSADPGEVTNLAKQQPDLVKRLQFELDNLKVKTIRSTLNQTEK